MQEGLYKIDIPKGDDLIRFVNKFSCVLLKVKQARRHMQDELTTLAEKLASHSYWNQEQVEHET